MKKKNTRQKVKHAVYTQKKKKKNDVSRHIMFFYTWNAFFVSYFRDC